VLPKIVCSCHVTRLLRQSTDLRKKGWGRGGGGGRPEGGDGRREGGKEGGRGGGREGRREGGEGGVRGGRTRLKLLAQLVEPIIQSTPFILLPARRKTVTRVNI
jgi:hypothetical protein